MIFIIDAHLPKSLCKYFSVLGHTAFHTTDFPLGNATFEFISVVIMPPAGDYFYGIF